jgi:hypothetical protein
MLITLPALKTIALIPEATPRRYCTVSTRTYAEPILSKKNSSQPQIFTIKEMESAVDGVRNGHHWFSARGDGIATVVFP